MNAEEFSRRDVERSFRKFSDVTSDLMRSDFRTWLDTLNHLIDHCENDPVMRVVTGPLRDNPNVDIEKWLSDFSQSGGSMAGSCRYTLPTNDDERTALLYQFLKKFLDPSFDMNSFCVRAYGLSRFQDMTDKVNGELVRRFVREVEYRLQEIETDTVGQAEVSREALIVFQHYHAPVQRFENVHNSQIATGDLMGTGSQKSDDRSVKTGDITNSNVAAHSSHVTLSVSVGGDAGDILDKIVAILRSDQSIPEEDRDDALQDVESLKLQLGKKKKDKGTIEKILGGLVKIGPVAVLANKLLEQLPSLMGHLPQ